MATRTIWCKSLLGLSLRRVHQSIYYSTSTVYRPNNSANHSNLFFSCTLLQHYQYHVEKVPYLHQAVRYYAKSRDKKKSDKGQKKKVLLNEELLTEIINVSVMRGQMQGAIDKLKDDFIKNLSLRSTSGSIETLPITFEGKNYILQDVAQVVRKNPKTVVINMVSFPQVIPTVIQAINKSGMNLNPQQDGTTLFIAIPKVTKEHRETLSKNAKGLFIKCRDSIKDVQNKFIKTVKLKEKDGLAKDTVQQISDFIEYTASEYIAAAETVMEAKQQELLKEVQ